MTLNYICTGGWSQLQPLSDAALTRPDHKQLAEINSMDREDCEQILNFPEEEKMGAWKEESSLWLIRNKLSTVVEFLIKFQGN